MLLIQELPALACVPQILHARQNNLSVHYGIFPASRSAPANQICFLKFHVQSKFNIHTNHIRLTLYVIELVTFLWSQSRQKLRSFQPHNHSNHAGMVNIRQFTIMNLLRKTLLVDMSWLISKTPHSHREKNGGKRQKEHTGQRKSVPRRQITMWIKTHERTRGRHAGKHTA